MTPLPLRHRFDFEGHGVAWDKAGSGPPIVLLHGFPWSSQAWRRVVPWLALDHQVFYFDMVGTGRSEKSDRQDVSPSVQDRLLTALIAHWSLERPYIVGHDFGGLAALRSHLIGGLQYTGMTLIDSVALLPSGSPFFAHARTNAEIYQTMPDFVHEAVFASFVNFGSYYGLSDSVARMYFEPWSGKDGQAAFYRHIAQSSSAPLEEVQNLLSTVTCSTHVIWGRHDHNIDVELGERLSRIIRAQSFSVLPKAAHIVHEDTPEALVGLLKHHLSAAYDQN